MNLKTQKEIDDHIINHKDNLKKLEKTFGFKKKSITLPTFMWIKILNELQTSAVFSGRLSVDCTGYGLTKDAVEWDTELVMAIELLENKLK